MAEPIQDQDDDQRQATSSPSVVPTSDAATLSAAMTSEELAEAKAYGREELFCELAGRAIDLTFLAMVAIFLGRPNGWLMRMVEGDYPQTLQVAAVLLLLLLGGMLVSFPLSFYSGHVLQHRYQLSRQSFSQWLWRMAKRYLLEIVFAVILVPGLYWIIWICHGWWWLVAAAIFFVLSVVLGQLAPVLILPIFYKITPLDDDQRTTELHARMQRISQGTGLSIEGVYRMELSAETSKANAMLAGLGRTRRVILADTLLEHFTADEIEVIFAHEVGHHVHRHIRKMILFGGCYSVFGFLVSDWVLRAWIHACGGEVDYTNFPIYTLPMLILVITLFSTCLEPLQNSISRYFERQADRYALLHSPNHAAYRSAFFKLARQNKDDPDPHSLEVIFFHSHPPIAERLALADA